MVVKRGEVWWAALDEPQGSEPGYRRPVVIVSSNDFNQSKINTVIVCIMTSSLRLADAPGNFLVAKKESGLPKESVVNVSQVITLDKSFLSKKSGKLSAKKTSFFKRRVKTYAINIKDITHMSPSPVNRQ